ncbi:MAG: hypothetical protein SFV55_26300 [Haliscomenobacter sp.]|uniref:hypothetical protein n=1 Tax=Haliscomenobacter sp. TaxID=2717303 RepID=UPI0029BA02C2|nr:hypothetical protein [Haliscomenobacter sp.]MDX2071973.1 hypothetical protein [Haliscomenobacter sp.]
MEQNEKSLPGKIWDKSWFILSALMNAVSLINLGRDLKPALLRWSELLLKSLELFRVIRDFLLTPLISLFKYFDAYLPSYVKDLSLIVFIYFSIWYKSKLSSSRDDYSSIFTWVATFFIASLFTVAISIGALAFSSAGSYGKIIFISMLIIACFIDVSAMLFRPNKNEFQELRSKIFKEFVLVTFITIFIIIITNYIIITFGK